MPEFLITPVIKTGFAVYNFTMAIRYTPSPWATTHSPSIEDIGQLAEQAYRALPENFHAMCGDIVIRVEEIADPELIEFLGGSSSYDLMGLFHPAGESLVDSIETPMETHAIIFFRRAILDYWAEADETLGNIVTHIIVQEIGRQFNLDEDQLEAIEIATLDEADRDAKSLMQ